MERIKLPEKSELVSLMAKEKKVQRRMGVGETRDKRKSRSWGGGKVI